MSRRAEHEEVVHAWRKAFGRLALLGYIVAACVYDWRPADIIQPWLPRLVTIAINMLVLFAAWRIARRIGARYGRWRLHAADRDLPNTSRKDAQPCPSTPTAPTTPRL